MLFVVAFFGALLVSALGSPVPASIAAPGAAASTEAATFAPIGVQSSADPEASAAPGQPKVLGHVYTSAYCSEFVEHYDAAATTIIGNDQHLTNVDATLQDIENNYDLRNGASRVYDDRVKLIGDVGQMLKTIPASQKAVDDLLAQAKATTDPDRKAALQEAASELQHTVDHQRAVANDLTNVVHVLMDKHTSEDTAETAIQWMMLPGYSEHGISLNDDPVPPPGEDSIGHHEAVSNATPSASPSPGSVEDVMQWGRQRSVIATSESNAAAAAQKVVRICDDEHAPTPPPGAIGTIAPSPDAPSSSPSP